MNKVFLGLILTVCILGMALVMLNDRLGRKAEPRPPAATQTPINDTEMAINARFMELAEAAKALAPPPPDRLPDVQPESRTEPPARVADTPPPDIPPAAAAPQMPSPRVDQLNRAERQEHPAVETKATPQREEGPRAPAPKPPKAEPAKAEPAKAEVRPETPKVTATGNTATRFVIYARDKGATVRLGGNGKMAYSSMTLDNPPRIVIDLNGDWKFPPNPGIPKNDLVSAVRVGQNGDKTRIVIDLKEKPRKVNLVPFKGGDGVDVRVDK